MSKDLLGKAVLDFDDRNNMRAIYREGPGNSLSWSWTMVDDDWQVHIHLTCLPYNPGFKILAYSQISKADIGFNIEAKEMEEKFSSGKFSETDTHELLSLKLSQIWTSLLKFYRGLRFEKYLSDQLDRTGGREHIQGEQIKSLPIHTNPIVYASYPSDYGC